MNIYRMKVYRNPHIRRLRPPPPPDQATPLYSLLQFGMDVCQGSALGAHKGIFFCNIAVQKLKFKNPYMGPKTVP